MGLLTDGNSWGFHYIKPTNGGFELYRAPRITSTEDDILGYRDHLGFPYFVGLLVHCWAGITTKEYNTSLFRIVRSLEDGI